MTDNHSFPVPDGTSKRNTASGTRSDATRTADRDDLQSLVQSAVRTLCPASGHAALSLVASGRDPETITATSDLPVRADWLQSELGEGPLLRLSPGEVVVSPDLTIDGRWPEFGALAARVFGVGSLLTSSTELPIGSDKALLALTVYAERADSFDELSRRLAVPALARLVPAAAGLCERISAGPVARDLTHVLATALDLLASRHRVSIAQAFELLRRTSSQERVPLFDVADSVVRGPGAAGLPGPVSPDGIGAEPDR